MDGLGSIGSLIGGIGHIADELVTALTGDKGIGDAVGLMTNLATGNYLGAAEEAGELITDVLSPSVAPELDAGTEAAKDVADSAHPAANPPSWRALEPTVDLDPAASLDLAPIGTSHVGPGRGRPAPLRGATGYAPAGAATGKSSLAAALRSILSDPSLSMEDKVSMLLSEMLTGLDDDVEGTMDKLQQMQGRKEAMDAAKNSKHGGKHPALPAFKDGEAAPSAADISRISSELQMLMQRRSQMQSLLSNVMSVSHQSAMRVISNIR